MARVASGSSTRPSSAHSIAAQRQRRQTKAPYSSDVKSKGAIASNTRPPNGYTFLAIGHADLSNRCKEISKERNIDFIPVSTRQSTRNPQIQQRQTVFSTHLTRIGYHIRTDVFDEACDELRYSFVDGKLAREVALDPTSGFETAFARYGADLVQMGARTIVNPERERATNLIRELFPRIPEASVEEIWQTAYQKGAKTIGNADNVPEVLKAQLAVSAHIRHTYTDYDRLLHEVGYINARKAIQSTALSKIVEWRGEDDANLEDLEGILQDTIYISDDDDNASPAEASEPDRYADNEDSDDVYEVPPPPDYIPNHDDNRRKPKHRRQRGSHVGDEKRRPILEARWQDAQQMFRRAFQESMAMPPPPVPAPSATRPANVAAYDVPSNINVPLDRKGRAPKSFVENGVEFVRINPADVRSQISQTGQMPPPPPPLVPPVAFQYLQPPPRPGMPIIPPPPPVILPALQFAQAGANGSVAYELVSAPVQPAQQQRFFDVSGREVLIDPTKFELIPAGAMFPNAVMPTVLPHPVTESILPAPRRAQPSPSPGYAQTVNGDDSGSGSNDDYEPPSGGSTRAHQQPEHLGYSRSEQHPIVLSDDDEDRSPAHHDRNEARKPRSNRKRPGRGPSAAASTRSSRNSKSAAGGLGSATSHLRNTAKAAGHNKRQATHLRPPRKSWDDRATAQMSAYPEELPY